MKWRERISILSRKRNNSRSGVSAAETSGNKIAASGTSHDAKNDVEKTLSQIRPVIGPDHKSYYILLRGNEDSFTCIQPSKEVITSLDDVVKNVVSSVRQGRPQDVTSLPYAWTSKNSGARSYKNVSRISPSENRKASVSSPSVNKESRITRTLNLDKFNSRSEKNFLGTENVVENVVVHRRLKTKVKSSHNSVKRTSISVHPIVQSQSDPSGNLLETNRLEKYLCKTNKRPFSRETTSEMGVQYERKLSRNQKVDHIELEKADHEVQVNQDHLVQGKAEPALGIHEPAVPWKQESLVQMSEDVFGSVNETVVPESGFNENAKPLAEIRLVAKSGLVLTEEVIVEQVKALIESQTLVIKDDAHIVLTRGNAQEVILRILPKEFDENHLFGNQQEEFESDDLLPQQDDNFPSRENTIVLRDSEESCCSPVLDEPPNKRVDPGVKTTYPLTSLSPSSHEMFEDPGVKSADLEELLKRDKDSYCMVDSLQDADPVTIERILLNEVSLLRQSQDQIVVHRSDGGLVTEDGPIPDDLQSFISSLPDVQTYVPDGYVNHIFQSSKP
ncbi:uncharacterized protein [Macrobrachium rosenbergii]|uniref:uncharacterized protein n=1 Tax=Macrobrachium rosenbergii TaxID=79674 RepID=UPI0034D49136